MTTSTKTKTIKLRWALAHEPITTFEAAAKRFAGIVGEKTAGAVQVEVLSAADIVGGRKLTPAEVVELVASGRVEMCQTYTTALGKLHEPLWVLDLPYLFKDHAHAERVLDGAVGQGLLEGLRKVGLVGLAFTYSGGFRITVSRSKEIRRADDFRGLRVRTAETPVAEAIMRRLGAEPLAAPLRDVRALADSGRVDAAEITYPRYAWQGLPAALPVSNETWHSLLLTSMTVHAGFWDRLEPAHRQAVAAAAVEAALIERATSIEEGKQAMANEASLGYRRVAVPEAELARLRELTAPVYGEFEPRFGADLIGAIRGA